MGITPRWPQDCRLYLILLEGHSTILLPGSNYLNQDKSLPEAGFPIRLVLRNAFNWLISWVDLYYEFIVDFEFVFVCIYLFLNQFIYEAVIILNVHTKPPSFMLLNFFMPECCLLFCCWRGPAIEKAGKKKQKTKPWRIFNGKLAWSWTVTKYEPWRTYWFKTWKWIQHSYTRHVEQILLYSYPSVKLSFAH
jgi:hypothetical protein